jgi:hypothetical protein
MRRRARRRREASARPLIRALVLGAAAGAILFLPGVPARADVIGDTVTTVGDAADGTLDGAAAGLEETVEDLGDAAATVGDPVNDVGGTVEDTVDPVVDVVDDPVIGDGGDTAPEPPAPDTSQDGPGRSGSGADGRARPGADGPPRFGSSAQPEPFGEGISTMRPGPVDDGRTSSSAAFVQDSAAVDDALSNAPEAGGPSFVTTSGGFALGIVAAVIGVFLLFHAAALWLRISGEGPAAGRQASTLHS